MRQLCNYHHNETRSCCMGCSRLPADQRIFLGGALVLSTSDMCIDHRRFCRLVVVRSIC